MNPDRPFAWLSLEPRRDAPPRPVPLETHKIDKSPTDPFAVVLKRIRTENKILRRRVRVLERSRAATQEERVGERDYVDPFRYLRPNIVRLIGEFLVDNSAFATLAALAVTSRRNHSTLLPVLYRCLIWDSLPAWQRMYPHVRKKFKMRRKSSHWIHTRHLVVDSDIWNIIHQKADHLFPNLVLVIVKHATYARTYNPSDRRHLTASETRAIPDDEAAPMPLEFLCDIDLRGPVSAHTMSRILGTPLRWEYGSRTMTRTIRTVEHVLVRSRGIIEPVCGDAPNEYWRPSVPHENLDVLFETANPSTGVLHTMRYICHFIHPSEETVWGGIKFGADCTLRLSFTGDLQIYHVFTSLLEEILTRGLVINILINLGTPRPRIPHAVFKGTMLHTATIYSRAWPHIVRAQTARQPRYQWTRWDILSVQYVEVTLDAQGLRSEYGSSGCISTGPGDATFRLHVSHARRFRERFTKEYGPFGGQSV